MRVKVRVSWFACPGWRLAVHPAVVRSPTLAGPRPRLEGVRLQRRYPCVSPSRGAVPGGSWVASKPRLGELGDHEADPRDNPGAQVQASHAASGVRSRSSQWSTESGNIQRVDAQGTLNIQRSTHHVQPRDPLKFGG